MVEAHVRRGVYGLGAALVVAALLLVARIAVAPTADGYRHALAAGPQGSLYAAEGGRLLRVGPLGGVRDLGATGPGMPLVLGADGAGLVLGTDRGVAVSQDGGATWRAAPLPGGRYPAVSISGSTVYAGRWAGEIWTSADLGQSWRSLGSPGGGEYLAVAQSQGTLYAATLTGVVTTVDSRAWEATSLPSRVTALAPASRGVVAGDWRGDVYALQPGLAASRLAALGAGIWALSGSLAATTDGVRGPGTVALAGREVTALVSAGPVLYAGVARGPVLASSDGGRTWRAVLHG